MASGTKDEDATQQNKTKDGNPLECPVCFTVFNSDTRRPRTLPCGHTFCTPCLKEVVKEGNVTCPTCRARYNVPGVDHLPICYALEAIMKQFKDSLASLSICGQKEASQRGTSDKKSAKGLSRSAQSLIHDQDAKALATISACEEIKSQLDQYEATLMDWHDQQQQFEDKLQAVIDDSRTVRVLMKQEQTKVIAKREEVQQMEQQLAAALETLQNSDKEQDDVGTVVLDVIHCNDEAEESVQECRKMFPDFNTMIKVKMTSKMADKVCKVLKAGDDVQEDPTLPTDSIFNSKKKIQTLMTQKLQWTDLRDSTPTARALLRDGLVFAVHEIEGQILHGKITLKNNRQYLHCLREQNLPVTAATVPFTNVKPCASPCLLFLDLAWPGNGPHRVLIWLSSNTWLGEQFMLMCTGKRGHNYLNTNLYRVVEKGTHYECICGGDYEYNDGSGGAALPIYYFHSPYKREGDRGDVFNVNRDTTQFAIVTGISRFVGSVFGEVVEGFQYVQAAAKHDPINEVNVVDCGVVLWQTQLVFPIC